ncbi:hypothetical protein OEZ86_004194 [Tetradesmus obliquus]|nr:hypothetical protein OEZ86_004194 [Tetradesmus obliquus]
MLKKLKKEWRELKDAFKSKKGNGKSTKGEPDSRLLRDSPVGDDKVPTALSRPHGLRGSLDIQRSTGAPGAGTGRPGYTSDSGMLTREMPSVGPATAAAVASSSSKGPEPSRTPRDEDLGGCPPYATKAVWGLRYTMEDKWAAVPNLIQLPAVLTQPQRKGSSSSSKAAGCGCMIKPSKVLAKVSPSGRDKASDRAPLIAHHGSEDLDSAAAGAALVAAAAASSLAAAAAGGSGGGLAQQQDMDSIHYFGVFDGHGGADAAWHCAQRMHQTVRDTICSMLGPEVAATLGLPPSEQSLAEQPAAAGATSSEAAEADKQEQEHQQPQPQQAEPQQQEQQAQEAQQQQEQQQPQQEQQQQLQQPTPAAEPLPQSAAANATPAAAAAAAAAAADAPPSSYLAGTAPAVEPASMASLLSSNGSWLLLALSKSFVTLDSEFGVLSEGSYVGSTAVVVLLSSMRLWVAHAGDSRAVLGRKGSAVVLTSDHKASRDDEVQRVQAAGGHVWWDRVMGELAVSRAIGDHCLRPYVIPEPEVLMVERSREDEVLVMASDGLWDVIGNQEAADMAVHSLQAAEASGHSGVAAAKRAATSLTKAALERGTRDNVTVLVVDLRLLGASGQVSSSSNASNHSSSHASGDEKHRMAEPAEQGQASGAAAPAAAAAAAAAEEEAQPGAEPAASA